MRGLSSGGTLAWVAVAASLQLAGALSAFAQSAAVPMALPSLSGKASQRQVDEFRADRARFLRVNPIGGSQMSAIAKALSLAEPGLIDALLQVAADGNAQQRAAIGTGLGQAVKVIGRVDRPLAEALAAKVAGASLADLIVGYAIGTGEAQAMVTGSIGAVGTAAAGVGGPVGGFLLTGGFAPSAAGGAQEPVPGSGLRGAAPCTESVSPRRRC